jgi:hypothetical protein
MPDQEERSRMQFRQPLHQYAAIDKGRRPPGLGHLIQVLFYISFQATSYMELALSY